MIQDTFLDCILIISTNYKQLCNLEKTYYDFSNKEIITFTLAKTIIDKLIINGSQQHKIPKILLIGGDSEKVWPVTKEIINYIKQQDYEIDINIQIENISKNIDFFKEQLLFLKEYNITINYIYNNATKLYLSIIYNYCHTFNLKVIIDSHNFLQIYDIYSHIADKYNSLKLEFLFNNNSLQSIGTRENIKSISKQLQNITNAIYTSFQNNIIPLIPINFINNFLNYYILYEQERLDIQYFSDSYNIKTYCNILNGIKIIINQKGELFLCSCNKLTKDNNMYCGHIEDNKFIELQNFNIIKKIYNVEQFTDIQKKDRCQNCNITSICQLGCFSNNLLNTNSSLLPSKMFCIINEEIQKNIKQLILKLNQEKNELFKTYFYIVCQQGRLIQ